MSLILTISPFSNSDKSPQHFNYKSDAVTTWDLEAIEDRLLLDVRLLIRQSNSLLAYWGR